MPFPGLMLFYSQYDYCTVIILNLHIVELIYRGTVLIMKPLNIFARLGRYQVLYMFIQDSKNSKILEKKSLSPFKCTIL